MPATEFVESPLMYELVVIGAGPAGLAAALFTAGQRIKVVVVAPEVGGQAIHSTHVENYMGFEQIAGARLVKKFEDQIKEYYSKNTSPIPSPKSHTHPTFSSWSLRVAVLYRRDPCSWRRA
tara:strand:+ start:123 stop:485 length:363 start_codon:yes stop_codon:yes gene_type:complete